MRMMMRLQKMGDEEINLRSVFGLGDSGEWKQMMKTHAMTDMGDESSEMGIGRFGRMETDEEEDNATEMCNKQI